MKDTIGFATSIQNFLRFFDYSLTYSWLNVDTATSSDSSLWIWEIIYCLKILNLHRFWSGTSSK